MRAYPRDNNDQGLVADDAAINADGPEDEEPAVRDPPVDNVDDYNPASEANHVHIKADDPGNQAAVHNRPLAHRPVSDNAEYDGPDSVADAADINEDGPDGEVTADNGPVDDDVADSIEDDGPDSVVGDPAVDDGPVVDGNFPQGNIGLHADEDSRRGPSVNREVSRSK